MGHPLHRDNLPAALTNFSWYWREEKREWCLLSCAGSYRSLADIRKLKDDYSWIDEQLLLLETANGELSKPSSLETSCQSLQADSR
jgi:hypothetical protein